VKKFISKILIAILTALPYNDYISRIVDRLQDD